MEHVASAAVDTLDERQAGCRSRSAPGHRDDVADFVANDRLHVVGQVGDEHFRAGRAGWNRLVVFVDDFENRPIGVHVHAGRGRAAIGEKRALTHAIVVEDRRAEHFFVVFPRFRQQQLADIDDLLSSGWKSIFPCFDVACQLVQDAGVGREMRGSEFVELGHKVVVSDRQPFARR